MTKKTADNSSATDKIRVQKARRLFLIRFTEMSMKLALAFLLPALIGIFADKKFDSEYLWSISGIVVGVVFGGFIVKDMIEKVNKDMGVR